MAHQRPTRPARSQDRAAPPRPPRGGAFAPTRAGRTRPFGVFAHLSRRDTCPAQANRSAMLPLSADKPHPYPRISPTPYPRISHQPLSAGKPRIYPRVRVCLIRLSVERPLHMGASATNPSRPAERRAAPAIGLRPFGPETVPRTVSGTGLTPWRALRFRRAGRCPLF